MDFVDGRWSFFLVRRQTTNNKTKTNNDFPNKTLEFEFVINTRCRIRQRIVNYLFLRACMHAHASIKNTQRASRCMASECTLHIQRNERK